MPPLGRLHDALRFARGIRRAMARGHSFTAASRAPMRGAPGGTRETPRQGSALRRLVAERGWFEHSVHVVPIAGLDRPLRVLHLTDVHIRRSDPWLEQLCATLPAHRPDLVVLTGDVVTRGWQREAAGRFLESLPEAPLGRFAVLGNWEYWGDAPQDIWEAFLAEHGVTLLQNRSVDLGGLTLAGVDDLLAGEPDVDAALIGISEEQPALVLSHSPAIFPALQRGPVRLVLSGHSHAGQLRIPGLGAPFLPLGTGPYVGGWFTEGGVHLFVSRGIGWSVAPVRLFCPPEIAELRLVPAP
ncbi:MAG: metallophosphoesterase [Alphaproteobacteria bacterium]|nr:metallophosphoesterase [Alphaproteobacteria bacterium]